MYLFLAAFSTPLVLSVHSVVSFDFAMALTPGWHATIFPPYFVAGAIFSGIGMVFTIIHPHPEVLQAPALRHRQPPRRRRRSLCLFTSLGCSAAPT
jgi:Ni/Fe-hydrogenase subunit HybB-like protein